MYIDKSIENSNIKNFLNSFELPSSSSEFFSNLKAKPSLPPSPKKYPQSIPTLVLKCNPPKNNRKTTSLAPISLKTIEEIPEATLKKNPKFVSLQEYAKKNLSSSFLCLAKNGRLCFQKNQYTLEAYRFSSFFKQCAINYFKLIPFFYTTEDLFFIIREITITYWRFQNHLKTIITQSPSLSQQSTQNHTNYSLQVTNCLNKIKNNQKGWSIPSYPNIEKSKAFQNLFNKESKKFSSLLALFQKFNRVGLAFLKDVLFFSLNSTPRIDPRNFEKFS